MTQVTRANERRTGVRLNRGVLWLSRHWLRIAIILIGTYASLPVLAPTLMKLGVTGPARLIYTMYSPLCHQFAFRSVFLYGEQPFYPRYNTGSPLIPFESYAENMPEFAPDRQVPLIVGTSPVGDIYQFTGGYQIAAREFTGNEQMGYKTALCARDMGIYWALFIGALIYAIPVVRRKLRPVPIWLYVLLGIAPIALDGVSQLLGYPPFNLWPPRETLPAFRVITGLLFGFMNAWLGLPYLELSMRDTRRQIEAKFQRAGIPIIL